MMKSLAPYKDIIFIHGIKEHSAQIRCYPKSLLSGPTEWLGAAVGTLEMAYKTLLPSEICQRYNLEMGEYRHLALLVTLFSIHYHVNPILVVWQWHEQCKHEGPDPRTGELLTDLKGYADLFGVSFLLSLSHTPVAEAYLRGNPNFTITEE